jgi:dipeptide/tripeptide permease
LQEKLDVIMTSPNTISMLWQLPQYVVITVAEIMFSVTLLSFVFSEVKIESIK